MSDSKGHFLDIVSIDNFEKVEKAWLSQNRISLNRNVTFFLAIPIVVRRSGIYSESRDNEALLFSLILTAPFSGAPACPERSRRACSEPSRWAYTETSRRERKRGWGRDKEAAESFEEFLRLKLV